MTQTGTSEVERVDDGQHPWRLAVLLSGSGRTLDNLIAVIARGELHAEIICVVSSRSVARGIDIARQAGIPVKVVTDRSYPTIELHSRAIYEAVEAFQPDLLILAGYLRRMVVEPAWRERMLNIHPALLPQAEAYAAGRGRYGDAVHAAVLARGDVVSGATVHLVTDDYDSGPPLMQRKVPVLADDTVSSLAARVFEVERELYPEAIRQYMAAHSHLRRAR